MELKSFRVMLSVFQWLVVLILTICSIFGIKKAKNTEQVIRVCWFLIGIIWGFAISIISSGFVK